MLHQREDLSLKPQHPHKKPGMAAHVPGIPMLRGRRIETKGLWGSLAASLAPVAMWNVLEQDS